MGKILAFSGSARKGSYNKMLLAHAVEGAKAEGAEVKVIDFKDYVLPVYDADLEQEKGLPENAKKLKDLFWAHDALLIASPENNSGPSALLKNVIDWVSRPATAEEAFLSCFLEKKAALVSASIGYLGGSRGLIELATLLRNIMVTVLPQQKFIPFATEAFGQDGKLKDAKDQEAVKSVGAALAKAL